MVRYALHDSTQPLGFYRLILKRLNLVVMNEQRFWRKLNFYLSGNGLNRFVKKVEHLKK